MKFIKTSIFLLAFLGTCLTYGQDDCQTTVSILSEDSQTLYFQTTFGNDGNIESEIGNIPWGIPVRFTISGTCENVYFNSWDLDGNYDSYQDESAVYGSSEQLSEFVTVLNNKEEIPQPGIGLMLASNNGLFMMPLSSVSNALPPPPPGICETHTIQKCCDLYCVKFQILDENCPKCYLASIEFQDGTKATFPINFSNGLVVMNCFSKSIRQVIIVTPVDCRESGTSKMKLQRIGDNTKSENAPDRVKISPNPTKSTIAFEGDNLDKYKISIFDQYGKDVVKGSNTAAPLNLGNYDKGIYIYVITDEEGYKQTGKIIKE